MVDSRVRWTSVTLVICQVSILPSSGDCPDFLWDLPLLPPLSCSWVGLAPFLSPGVATWPRPSSIAWSQRWNQRWAGDPGWGDQSLPRVLMDLPGVLLGLLCQDDSGRRCWWVCLPPQEENLCENKTLEERIPEIEGDVILAPISSLAWSKNYLWTFPLCDPI